MPAFRRDEPHPALVFAGQRAQLFDHLLGGPDRKKQTRHAVIVPERWGFPHPRFACPPDRHAAEILRSIEPWNSARTSRPSSTPLHRDTAGATRQTRPALSAQRAQPARAQPARAQPARARPHGTGTTGTGTTGYGHGQHGHNRHGRGADVDGAIATVRGASCIGRTSPARAARAGARRHSSMGAGQQRPTRCGSGRPQHRVRRTRLRRRTLRQWQVDARGADRRNRLSDVRVARRRRHPHRLALQRSAGSLARPHRRHRLPGLPSPPHAVG